MRTQWTRSPILWLYGQRKDAETWPKPRFRGNSFELGAFAPPISIRYHYILFPINTCIWDEKYTPWDWKIIERRVVCCTMSFEFCNNDFSMKVSVLHTDLAVFQSKLSLLLSFIFMMRFSSFHCMFNSMNSLTISCMFSLLFFC